MGELSKSYESYARRVRKFRHTGYIYFASPYSHDDSDVRRDRETQASRMAAQLTELGLNLFCPITQSERLKDFLSAGDLPHEGWMEIDIEFLKGARALIIYTIPGWSVSAGVQQEIEYAHANDIPTYYTVGKSAFLVAAEVANLLARNLNTAGTNLDASKEVEDSLAGREVLNDDAPIEKGVKDSKGKARVGLVPYDAEVAISRIREYGNKKYKDPAEWYKYPEREDDFVEAAKRHLDKHIDAKLLGVRSLNDEESGLAHLDHAIASLALAIALRDKPR